MHNTLHLGMPVDRDARAYRGFVPGKWSERIEVRDFIQKNYTPYEGDDVFLAPTTGRTNALWQKVLGCMEQERKRGGIFDIDENTISTIVSHKPGYIDKELETIVGLQTDEPLKRAIMPNGGVRMVYDQLEAYGRPVSEQLREVYKHRKTHNDGVFDAYTDEMKRARKTGVITGLPDAYGRGRIIGDYRRPALYGVDYLIAQKKRAHKQTLGDAMTEDVIRAREEIAEQIRSLQELKQMAVCLWIRYRASGREHPRGNAMAVFCVSGCGKGTEWCRDEPWADLDIPRYLRAA
jgi:formate C-acetyltransferase